MATFKNRLTRTTWRLRPPVLALGGGGARGFAHLGVLKALDDADLSFRAIAGTSMGAVVGAMYLAYGSAARAIDLWRDALDQELIPTVRPIGRVPDADAKEHPLIQVARRIKNRVVISFTMNRSTVLDDSALVQALEYLCPDLQFSDLPKPLAVVATNLETGAEVRLRTGPLRPAMVATSAIPGMVPAVEIEGQPLVDGGVVAEVPTVAAREMGWPVVAVDVSPDVLPLGEDDLVLDTMMRTQMMTAGLLRRRQLRSATHIIRPDVGDARWAEWNRFDEFIEAGRKATLDFLGL